MSAGIRVFEYNFWASHVEWAVPPGVAGMTPGLFGAHANGGVLLRPMGYDAPRLIKEQYVSLPIEDDGFGKFIEFMHKQNGLPYDLDALAGIAFNRDWRAENAWFCSELVAAALEHCGWFPFMLAQDIFITPRDLYIAISARVEINPQVDTVLTGAGEPAVP